MTRALSVLLVLVAVSACQRQPAPAAKPTEGAAPGDYVAKVEALAPKQRDAVLFRAIRDAGQDCQEVTDSTRTATTDGKPAWIATCDGRTRWTVVLSNDGVATVAGIANGG